MENEDSVLSLIEENFKNALSSDSESTDSEENAEVQIPIDANPLNINILEPIEENIHDLTDEPLYSFDEDTDMQRDRRGSACGASFSFCFYLLYSVGVMIATAVILSVTPYGGRRCDQPLRMWNIVHASMLGSGLLLKLWSWYNICYVSQRNFSELSLFFKVQSRWVEFLQKIFNLLLFVWIIVGMVWTFSSTSCKSSSTPLYYLSFGIVIFDITIIGLVLLFFLVLIGTFSCVYFFFPTLLGINQPPPGATEKMISDLESPREYVPGNK